MLPARFALFAGKKNPQDNVQVLYQFSVRLQAQPLNDVAEKQKPQITYICGFSVKAVIVPDLFLAWLVKPGRQ